MSSVHGDEHAHPAPMGCGFSSFGRWDNCLVWTHRIMILNGSTGPQRWRHETLEGSHSESKVINLVADTTTNQKRTNGLLLMRG